MPSRVGTFQGLGTATTQNITGLPFQPGLELVASNFTSSTTTIQTSAHIAFGAGTSSTSRVAAAQYSRYGRNTMQTASAFLSNHLMASLDNSDNVVNQFDLVSQNADGFSISWDVGATYISPYLAISSSNINSKVGYFDLGTGAGTQDVTTGNQPKLVILFTATPNATEGGHAQAYFGWGAADLDGNVFSAAMRDVDAVSSGDTARYFSASHAFTLISISSVVAQIDTVTMLANGFRVNKSNPPSGTLRIGYIAIGGTGFDAKVGTVTQPASTGSVAYTWPGFEPDSAIFINPAMPTASIGTISTHAHMGIGFGDALASNAAVSCASDDGNPVSFSNRRLSLTHCILTMGLASATDVNARAAMSATDETGFTLDWTVTDGADRTYGVVAIKTDYTLEPGELFLEGASDITLQVVGNVTIVLDVETAIDLASGEDITLSLVLGATGIDPAALLLEGASDIGITWTNRQDLLGTDPLQYELRVRAWWDEIDRLRFNREEDKRILDEKRKEERRIARDRRKAEDEIRKRWESQQ